MSDSDYEEESVVTVVELKGIMNSDILFQEKPAKILAPESENPVLQFGDYIFRGEWQQTVGTVVCFEKPEEKDSKDQKCKFVAKADKKLSLQRIFLEQKKECQNRAESSSKVVNGNEVEMKESDLCNGHNHTTAAVNGNVEKQKDGNMGPGDVVSTAESTHCLTTDHCSSGSSGINVRASCSGYQSSSLASAPESSKGSPHKLPNKSGVQRLGRGKRIHPKDLDASPRTSGSDDDDLYICEKSFKFEETAGKVLNDVLSQIESSGAISVIRESVSDFSSLAAMDTSDVSVVGTSNTCNLNIASSSCHRRDYSSSKDAEVASESEDKSVGSSEADFIVLSEYCNEASCDTEGDIHTELNEPAADSSDEVCSTQQKLESLSADCVESSGNEVGTAGPNAKEGNLVTVIVDSLLSEVQSMHCSDKTSISPLVHDDDVADSASSVEENKCTQRNSESFYPLICDSASGEGVSRNRQCASDDLEMNTADCSDTFHISTSARINSSQYLANVFEDEAMDTTENIERLPFGNEVDSVEVMEATASENAEHGSGEILNFPKQCSDKGGIVNSTMGGPSNVLSKVVDVQEEEVSGSSEEDDSYVSHSSSTIPQNFSKPKDSGLIDSTSNKVCSMNICGGSNLKPTPGIDSTTNESGKKQCPGGESSKSGSNTLPTTVNEKIDSTMNRVEVSIPPEDVDFEMREATNVAEVEEDVVCENSSIQENEPIDSTSSIIRHTQNFSGVGNVSESSAIDVGESSRQSCIESRVIYSPCNVSESHIDDGKPLSSFVVSSPGSENLQSELAESSERSSENLQDIAESDSYDPQNFDIAESSLQDDSCGASSSQAIGPCGSSSFKKYRVDLDIDTEEDSVNKVTESTNSPNYTSTNTKVSISAHEVTDSTNISYSSSHLSSEDFSESPLVLIGDSSVCEVTESSSVIGEDTIVGDAQDSFRNNSRHIYSQHCTESPSSAYVASGSDVTESRQFENESMFNTDNNSSSGDGKEPSSSGLNTSEIHVSEACSSAGVISIESEMYCYSSAGSQDIATNEASMSSSSVYWSSPLLTQPSEYEISNSLEQNADSTEGENQSPPSDCNNDSSVAGGDSSKLPSSTSN